MRTRNEIEIEMSEVRHAIDNFDPAQYITEQDFDDHNRDTEDEYDNIAMAWGIPFPAWKIVKQFSYDTYRAMFNDFIHCINDYTTFPEYNELVDCLSELEDELLELIYED